MRAFSYRGGAAAVPLIVLFAAGPATAAAGAGTGATRACGDLYWARRVRLG